MASRAILEDLHWLVAEKSVYREEALQLRLARRLNAMGFQARLQYIAAGRPNLIALRGEEPSLLLVTHADTFPAHGYDRPWELRMDQTGRLYGRGVVDAKGQIAAALAAFAATDSPVAFACVVDEEVDGRGSMFLELPQSIEAAVVLEPTNLKPARVQAGFLEVEVDIPGRTSHGSTPNDKENAIIRAMECFRTIGGLPFTRRLHPLLARPKVNLETMRGGGQRVVVPNQCSLRLDIQIPPGLTTAEVERQVCLAVKAFQGEITIVDRAEPFEISADSRVYRLLVEALRQVLGCAPEPGAMPSWTDAANIVARGIPAVVFGAGDLALAHSEREAVSLEELETMAEVIRQLLQLWTLPTP